MKNEKSYNSDTGRNIRCSVCVCDGLPERHPSAWRHRITPQRRYLFLIGIENYTQGKYMKKLFAVLFVLLSLGSVTQAYAGNCQHPDDTASDGSRCGGRSADSRPGGQ